MAAPVIHEVRLRDDISEGAVGGDAFLTTIIATASGREQRFIRWSQARQVWNIAHGVKTLEQAEELIAFFRAREGRAHGFRFKDWSDYKVTTAQNTTQLTTTTFQLVKRYNSGGVESIRAIYKPVTGTVAVFNQSGAAVAGWTVNTTTGIVTFGVAPGFVPKATFEFDIPVRFNVDHRAMTYTHALRRDWESIELVELKG